MRATKKAIVEAFRADALIDIPNESIFSVEQAVMPKLPAIEVIAISTSLQARPLVQHTMSVQCTVAGQTEGGVDDALDELVSTVRRRLSAAEHEYDDIVLDDGQAAVIELGGTNWSTTAQGSGGVVRGATVALTAIVNE